MKNSDYWKQRFDQVEQSANNKSVRYVKQLEKKYQTAAQQIDTQINAWYSRIAKNNEVSITDAKTLLSKSELKEFKWTVKDYIKYGQENSIDQAWMKELENASAKFHINRLEALKLECRQQIEVALANGQETMFDTLADVYKDSFYRSCFEVQKGIGVGFDVSKLDNNQVSRILNKPWSVDGDNFSKKVWGNKRKLINTMDQELSRMVLTGEAPNKTIQSIKKAMDTSLYNAKRLVLTEQAYFTSLAQKDAFGELDVEEYEIVATLDNRTSEKCQEMDGQHFPVKDMQPGLNAPPFHVFCRSTTCPYFNDEFTVNDKRAAKSEETGEWYEVPANMTYPEWKNSFVGPDGNKDDLTPIEPENKLTLKDKIQKIKDDIELNGGVVTEEHLKQAGEIVKTELVTLREPFKNQYEEAKKTYEAFGANELREQMKLYSQVNRGLKEPSELGLKSVDESLKKYNELYEKHKTLVSSEDFINAREAMTKAEKSYYGSYEYNSKQLKDKLSEIRQMGSSGLDVKSHLNNSRSSMRVHVEKAYDHYPTDWVDKSINRGKLNVKKVNRGYYNGYEIAISGYTDDDCFETAVHELGHRFESAVPEIRDMEKIFYDRRTQGESLRWLGNGYRRDEKTRFDNFLHSYMGKDYGGSAYELVSMGFEYAYTDPTRLWKDEDMAQWIYGILSLL